MKNVKNVTDLAAFRAAKAARKQEFFDLALRTLPAENYTNWGYGGHGPHGDRSGSPPGTQFAGRDFDDKNPSLAP